jgi:hypothetical protein
MMEQSNDLAALIDFDSEVAFLKISIANVSSFAKPAGKAKGKAKAKAAGSKKTKDISTVRIDASTNLLKPLALIKNGPAALKDMQAANEKIQSEPSDATGSTSDGKFREYNDLKNRVKAKFMLRLNAMDALITSEGSDISKIMTAVRNEPYLAGINTLAAGDIATYGTMMSWHDYSF